MALYKIKFLKKDGSAASIYAEGTGPEDAMLRENISNSSVVSCRRDYIEELDRKLPKSPPSLATQAGVVAIFSAKTSSGLNPSVVFDQTIVMFPEFKKQLPEVAKVQRVSEKIKVLNFDPQLQLLAQVGEQSGLIAEVLGDAADEAISRNKLINELRSKAVPSVLVAIFGILTLLIVPIFMIGSLEQMMHTPGLIFKSNICTTMIMAIGTTMASPYSWIALTAAIVGLYFTRAYWWPHAKKVPGLRFVETFFCMSRSYRFISAFLPMFARGVQLSATIELMERYAPSDAKKIYRAMLDHLGRGGSFSSAFVGDYWDPKLGNLMSGFDDMKQSAKLKLLTSTKPLMAQSMQKTGELLSGILTISGMAVSAAATMIIFFGLTIPLMSIGAKM